MSHERQLQNPEGQRLLAELRRVTARLPEVEEVVDGFGHTTFKVRKKSFVIAGMGEEGHGVREPFVRLVLAEVRHAIGDDLGARAAIAAAVDSLERRAVQIRSDALRESLYRLPEHVRIREWAAELEACAARP